VVLAISSISSGECPAAYKAPITAPIEVPAM
jgi:hypothetical protein